MVSESNRRELLSLKIIVRLSEKLLFHRTIMGGNHIYSICERRLRSTVPQNCEPSGNLPEMAYSLAIYRSSELLHCGGTIYARHKPKQSLKLAVSLERKMRGRYAPKQRYDPNIDTVFMSNLLDQLCLRVPGENYYARYFYILVY